MNDKLDKPPPPTPEKPFIDPAVLKAVDRFYPIGRRIEDSKRLATSQLFPLMCRSAGVIATEARKQHGDIRHR